MRSLFQSHLQTLGISVQKNAGKILFVAILVLSTFCVGLKSATIHSKVHQLWIQGMYRCSLVLRNPNINYLLMQLVFRRVSFLVFRRRTTGTRARIHTEESRRNGIDDTSIADTNTKGYGRINITFAGLADASRSAAAGDSG